MLLKLGMSSPDVQNVERVIAALGFEGFEADGFFDDKTENVVKDIQRSHGLAADGIIGERTLALLDRLYEPSKPNFSSSNFVEPAKEKQLVFLSEAEYPEILSRVHPILAEKVVRLIALAKAENYVLIVTQGLRTFEEQNRLFAKRPKVTNARGGQSYHNYGIAADVAFVAGGKISWDEKLYKNIGRWASQVGLTWGGNWKFVDMPHLQLTGMPSVREMIGEYNKADAGDRGVKAVWKKFVGF